MGGDATTATNVAHRCIVTSPSYLQGDAQGRRVASTLSPRRRTRANRCSSRIRIRAFGSHRGPTNFLRQGKDVCLYVRVQGHAPFCLCGGGCPVFRVSSFNSEVVTRHTRCLQLRVCSSKLQQIASIRVQHSMYMHHEDLVPGVPLCQNERLSYKSSFSSELHRRCRPR